MAINGNGKTPPPGKGLIKRLTTTMAGVGRATESFIVPNKIRVQGAERRILDSQSIASVVEDAKILLEIAREEPNVVNSNVDRPEALGAKIAKAQAMAINNAHNPKDPLATIETVLETIDAAKEINPREAKDVYGYPSPEEVLAGVKAKHIAAGIEEDFDHGRDRPLNAEQLQRLVTSMSPRKAYHVLRLTESAARYSVIKFLTVDQLLEMHSDFGNIKLDSLLGSDIMFVCDKLCGSTAVDREYVEDMDYAGLLAIAVRHDRYNGHAVFGRIISQDPQNLSRLTRNLPGETVQALLSDTITAKIVARMGDRAIATCLSQLNTDQIIALYSSLSPQPELLNALFTSPYSIAAATARIQNHYHIRVPQHTSLVLYLLQNTQQAHPHLYQAILKFIQSCDDQSLWYFLGALAGMNYDWAAFIFSTLSTQRALKLTLENIPYQQLDDWVQRMMFVVGQWNNIMALEFGKMLGEAARLRENPEAPRAERLDQLSDQQIAEHLVQQQDDAATGALNSLHPMRAARTIAIIRGLAHQQTPSWEERCYPSLNPEIHTAMAELLKEQKEEHFRQEHGGMTPAEAAARKLVELDEGFYLDMSTTDAKKAYRAAQLKYHPDRFEAETAAGNISVEDLRAKERRSNLITSLWLEGKTYFNAS